MYGSIDFYPEFHPLAMRIPDRRTSVTQFVGRPQTDKTSDLQSSLAPLSAFRFLLSSGGGAWWGCYGIRTLPVGLVIDVPSTKPLLIQRTTIQRCLDILDLLHKRPIPALRKNNFPAIAAKPNIWLLHRGQGIYIVPSPYNQPMVHKPAT